MRGLFWLRVGCFWLALSSQTVAADGELTLRVVDRQTGRLLPCRLHLWDQRERPRRVERLPFCEDHFVFDGEVTLQLPTGHYRFLLERGLEYPHVNGNFEIKTFADDQEEVSLSRAIDMKAEGWWSGDLDVRRPLHEVPLLMQAEDLHLAQVVTWENDEILDLMLKKQEELLVNFDGDRWFHASAGTLRYPGTVLQLFHLPEPLAVQSGARHLPPPSFFFETIESFDPDREMVWADLTRSYWWEMPTLVANGDLDSIRIAGSNITRTALSDDEEGGYPRDPMRFPDPWGNARWAQEIYFRLLDCGFQIPPSAGSGSGEVANPVGLNRMYAHLDGPMTYRRWWDAFRLGRVFVTNGPLLLPSVEGTLPGHRFLLPEGENLLLEPVLSLSTRRSISYLEIIKNGEIAHSVRLEEYIENQGRLPNLKFEESGWFLIRAVADETSTYRFAMTAPWYVQIGSEKRISRQDAQFFLDWIYQRARALAKIEDPALRKGWIDFHRRGRDTFKRLVEQANRE